MLGRLPNANVGSRSDFVRVAVIRRRRPLAEPASSPLGIAEGKIFLQAATDQAQPASPLTLVRQRGFAGTEREQFGEFQLLDLKGITLTKLASLKGGPAQHPIHQTRRTGRIQLGQLRASGPVAEEALSSTLQPPEGGEEKEDQQRGNPEESVTHGVRA